MLLPTCAHGRLEGVAPKVLNLIFKGIRADLIMTPTAVDVFLLLWMKDVQMGEEWTVRGASLNTFNTLLLQESTCWSSVDSFFPFLNVKFNIRGKQSFHMNEDKRAQCVKLIKYRIYLDSVLQLMGLLNLVLSLMQLKHGGDSARGLTKAA